MVELLVVIGVLLLLIGLIAGVASRAIYQQKYRLTQQTIQTVMLALDEFQTENPLRQRYDREQHRTFGALPPYALEQPRQSSSVQQLLGKQRVPGGVDSEVFWNRLARDLSGDPNGVPGDPTRWVWNGPDAAGGLPANDNLDDSRALYAYLKAYSPGLEKRISEAALKPLFPKAPSYFNPKGTGTGGKDTFNPDKVDLLAIHDAWGVPMDYMIYINCQWGIVENADGTPGDGMTVVERVPVLRSLGISREEYDAIVAANRTDPRSRVYDSSKWIFSSELPQPRFGGPNPNTLNESTGRYPSMQGSGSVANGWVRVKGLAEDYTYLPREN